MRAVVSRNAATLCAAFSFFVAGAVVAAQSPAAAPGAAMATPGLFSSLGDKPAIVFDAPSQKAEKIFVLARFQPVEVLVKLDKWIKIRDAENTLGWVEAGALGDKRFVQIAVPVADIHAARDANSALAFEAQRSVLLEVTGAAVEGWLPVRHRDGQVGFVRNNQVWGD